MYAFITVLFVAFAGFYFQRKYRGGASELGYQPV